MATRRRPLNLHVLVFSLSLDLRVRETGVSGDGKREGGIPWEEEEREEVRTNGRTDGRATMEEEEEEEGDTGCASD